MAIYKDRGTGGANAAVMKPPHDIDPKEKNGMWIADNIKYWYDQYLMGNSAITPADADKLVLDRAYLAGKQPTAQYKASLTADPYSTNKKSVHERKAFHNINWESLSSPMPKYFRKIQGLFLKQEHQVQAKATNEKATNDKLKIGIEKMIKNEMKPLQDKINLLMGTQGMAGGGEISKFLERDMDEVQMLSNLGEFKLPYEVASASASVFQYFPSDFK